MVAQPTKHRLSRCDRDSTDVQHLQGRLKAQKARAQDSGRDMQGNCCTAATHQERCILPFGVVQEPAQPGKHEEHNRQDVGVGRRGGVEHGQEPYHSSNNRAQESEDTFADGDIDLQKDVRTSVLSMARRPHHHFDEGPQVSEEILICGHSDLHQGLELGI